MTVPPDHALPRDLHHRVITEFPGEAHLTVVALNGLAEVAGRAGHDVGGIVGGVLDHAQGDLVRLTEALHDAHRRYGR